MAEDAAQTSSTAENLGLVQIRVGGLRPSIIKQTGGLNKDESGDNLEASLSLSQDAPLSELWNKFEGGCCLYSADILSENFHRLPIP